MKANIYRPQLKAVSRFMANKDIRYYLNGVKLESNAVQSRIIATDGHALAVARCDAKGDNEGALDIIMPLEAVQAILKWKAPHKHAADAPIVITDAGEEFRADWCGQSINFKPVDGKFPDYAKVIPTACSGEASHIDPDLLVKCKRASEDIGVSKTGYFGMIQGGDKPSLVTIGDDFVAVLMPMRADPIDVSDAAWAREPLPAPAPELKAVA